MNKQLQQLEKEIDNFAHYFTERYFDCEEPEVWWVSDEVGSCLYVNDYFFDVNFMMDFIRYDYSEKEMFEYYNKKLDAGMEDKTFYNIKTWKKLK